MQDHKPASDEPKLQQSELSDRDSSPATSSVTETDEFDSVLDVSGKNLELSLFDAGDSAAAADGLFVYRNVFNLMPKSLASFGGRLKTLKFFANEVNLFPPEFRDLVELECLQVKVSPLGLTGLPFHKLKALKELELSKVPPRPSGFPVLAEIAGLKSLTRLSVCHFSIRYLPPEIGCLSNLEYLDLSFNKIRSLPKEISLLNSLISLKVANNKLVEVPAGLSSLQKLENLDLSRNRLTSLGLLELNTMRNLRNLNLQYNKLLSCQIPVWVCCNLEGNSKDICSDEYFSSTVEMDVFEATIDEDGSISCDASSNSLSCHIPGSSSTGRCCVKRRMGKRWKRRQYLQQRARQERLNHSRMWKADNHGRVLSIKSDRKCEACKQAVLASESFSECPSDFSCVDQIKEAPSRDYEGGDLLDAAEDDGMSSKKGIDQENCSCVDCVTNVDDRENNSDCSGISSTCASASADKEERSLTVPNTSPKCKRQSDRFLDNPKPTKSRRSTDDQPDVSRKYNNVSFCSIKDHLPDGFYDAGRDRPFMSLGDYEQTLELDSREVILLDRKQDEELDSISLSAQAMVSRLKKLTGSRRRRDLVTDDNFLVASWLTLFVSDHFGGSDRSCIVERARKDVSGSNYCKPFVCTCATGNSESPVEPSKKNVLNVDDVVLREICEGSLKAIKASRNSVVVPIGALQFGVCRHRAILMKYLCDRMEPPVPCELVRGYLDFSPHAWNAILVQRAGSWVRMIVDACRPLDIREETDPEYFCRYVPLARINCLEISPSIPAAASCFPSLSACEEVEKAASSSVALCKVGSVEAAAKVRTKEVSAASLDEIRNFEYTCLGEVRILGVLKEHPCIVQIYGHKISSKWIAASEEKPEHRLLCSAILMEYVRGGSLKNYVEKLSKAGKKHVPIHLALFIARDVACALKELHSKHIIHRDIKSENILIDLDQKRADGSPTVKLSDFDRAVPLRSLSHTCCISHVGIPSPNVCVGTPRWMAPEVLRAIHEHKAYGTEVDIWSYGCLLLELLTLQFPYEGLPDSKIHNLLKEGKRPPLTEDLELLGKSEDPPKPDSPEELEETTDKEVEGLRFLIDVFCQCTNGNPAERPTAEDIYKMVLVKTSTFISSSS
uniref:Protein kinase domain-containing protein n=2 Tax=Opuntia streptacantha TaxID=393608 RepID=A0A7C8ZJJ6_OPUST